MIYHVGFYIAGELVDTIPLDAEDEAAALNAAEILNADLTASLTVSYGFEIVREL